MTYKTHLTGAIVAGIILTHNAPPIARVGFVLASGLGGLLADIDHPKSYIRRYILFFPKMRHRGFTHSIMALMLLSLVTIPLGINSLTVGLLWGYTTHIILDMLTVQGVQLFYPCKKRYKLGKMTTGTLQESILRYGIILLLFIYIWGLIK